MSATSRLPTVADFLRAGADAIRVREGQEANTRDGSVLDLVSGPAAMAWAEQVVRDRDLFRQIHTDTARGDRLEELVLKRYKVPMGRASRGQGKAVLTRLSSSLSGTLFEGTRLRVRNGATGAAQFYAIAQDVFVPVGPLAVEVPIRATRTGKGVAIMNPLVRELADKTFDTWAVASLICADGTDDEAPEAYIARARQTYLDARPGYRKRIEDACKAAGAAFAVLLDAGDLGAAADFGCSFVYVADAGYSTPQALQDACSDAVDAVHVGGCDVQVRPMTPTPVTLTLTVQLWAPIGDFDLVGLRQGIIQTVLAMFNARPRFWLFDVDSIAGEVHAVSDGIQKVEITTDPAEPTAAFVASLPRYTLAPSAVAVTFTGP